MPFAGKMVIEDMKVMAELPAEGLIVAPGHVPPVVADPRGLAALLSFGRLLTDPHCARLEADCAAVP